MSISIFANRRGSGEIRGRQIAERLGAKLNPAEGYEDDVCIWVKRQPPEGYPERTYLDIVDAHERVSWLKRHPDVGVIASSLSGQEYLARVLGREVRYIPQHHCNFENVFYPRSAPPTLGVVGGEASLPLGVGQRIGAYRFAVKTREQAVAAYRHIDVQVIFRGLDKPLKNSLKVINAASFGIPTVALPEPGLREVEGHYIRMGGDLEADVEGALAIDRQSLVEMAAPYHIDRIAEEYEKL